MIRLYAGAALRRLFTRVGVPAVDAGLSPNPRGIGKRPPALAGSATAIDLFHRTLGAGMAPLNHDPRQPRGLLARLFH